MPITCRTIEALETLLIEGTSIGKSATGFLELDDKASTTIVIQKHP